MTVHLITPEWPAPANVKAVISTREGGCSTAPWQSLNLGTHVGDEPVHVLENRHRLASAAGVSVEHIQWLDQVHGTDIVTLPCTGTPQSDAAVTASPHQVCVVMVADCLPVLFCDRAGRQVAVAHAGWRGLAGGILEKTVAQFEDPATVMAYLGPAIGAGAYEVGEAVRQAFINVDACAQSYFSANRPGHYLADLYGLARLRLSGVGVETVFGGGFCTYSDARRFFSFRRDGITGRQAAMIWLDRSN